MLLVISGSGIGYRDRSGRQRNGVVTVATRGAVTTGRRVAVGRGDGIGQRAAATDTDGVGGGRDRQPQGGRDGGGNQGASCSRSVHSKSPVILIVVGNIKNYQLHKIAAILIRYCEAGNCRSRSSNPDGLSFPPSGASGWHATWSAGRRRGICRWSETPPAGRGRGRREFRVARDHAPGSGSKQPPPSERRG